MKLLRPKNLQCFLVSTLVVAFTALLAGCGKEEETPPNLPPEDSMFFPTFKQGQVGGALVSADTTQHVALAATSVGLVTLAVNGALTYPRLMLAGVLSTKGQKDGDDWVWKRTFPLVGVEGELRGRLNNSLELEMYVDGLRDNTGHLDNFLWFTGDHKAKEGIWKIWNPGTAQEPGPAHSVVDINWKRASATDKDLTFLNTNTGHGKFNDSLAYSLKDRIASMAIHDEKSGDLDDGDASDFSVVWHVENGSGKMTKNTDTWCWETLDNGQEDMTQCPAGDWPLP